MNQGEDTAHDQVVIAPLSRLEGGYPMWMQRGNQTVRAILRAAKKEEFLDALLAEGFQWLPARRGDDEWVKLRRER